jgi:hypothetical protein
MSKDNSSAAGAAPVAPVQAGVAPHPMTRLSEVMDQLGAAYVLREISGDHYTAEHFQELKAAQEAVRDLVRDIDGHCWNDGFRVGLNMGRSAQRLQINTLREMSQRMAEDDGLWFVPQTAAEAYLQQELRKLCAAIEAPIERDH